MSGFAAKCPIDNNMFFLKGKVCPSQRIHDEFHSVWVCIKGIEDCHVVTSWCTCIVGTAETCNHVIAVLYKIN